MQSYGHSVWLTWMLCSGDHRSLTMILPNSCGIYICICISLCPCVFPICLGECRLCVFLPFWELHSEPKARSIMIVLQQLNGNATFQVFSSMLEWSFYSSFFVTFFFTFEKALLVCLLSLSAVTMNYEQESRGLSPLCQCFHKFLSHFCICCLSLRLFSYHFIGISDWSAYLSWCLLEKKIFLWHLKTSLVQNIFGGEK